MQTTKSFSTLQQILLNTLFHFPEIEHEIMCFLADNRLDLQNNNISLILFLFFFFFHSKPAGVQAWSVQYDTFR